MATETFDKNIVLDKKAAKRLAEILSRPVSEPRTEGDKKFWKENEKKAEEWLSCFKK